METEEDPKTKSWWIAIKKGCKTEVFSRRPSAFKVMKRQGYTLIEVVPKKKGLFDTLWP